MSRQKMKIAVLSDTHIPYSASQLPEKVLETLEKTDAIIHAGDFQDISVVELLEAMGDFYGVCGNMDPPEIRQLLPQKRIVTIAGFSIGIMHGWGSPNGLEDRIFQSFDQDKPHVIVYGHSHRPSNSTANGVLFFNPGSATDIRFAPFPSMGILTIGKKITGEIIKL